MNFSFPQAVDQKEVHHPGYDHCTSPSTEVNQLACFGFHQCWTLARFRDVTPVKQGSHFEALDDLLSRFNQEMLDSGLAGSIITIESLAYEASKDWRIDTESSLSTLSTKNVFNIRVFYESTETITHPQIGNRLMRITWLTTKMFLNRNRRFFSKSTHTSHILQATNIWNFRQGNRSCICLASPSALEAIYQRTVDWH